MGTLVARDSVVVGRAFRDGPRISFVGGTADPSTPPEAGSARDDNSSESAGSARDDNSREGAGCGG